VLGLAVKVPEHIKVHSFTLTPSRVVERKRKEEEAR